MKAWLAWSLGFLAGIGVGGVAVFLWAVPRVAADVIGRLLDNGALGVCASCGENESEASATHNLVMQIPPNDILGWKGTVQ